MAIKSKINYSNNNILGKDTLNREEISAALDNTPVQSTINYLENVNITPRDYYKGTSFRYAGEWLSGTHYLNDKYIIDFVVYNNVLLRCKKSHLSSSISKPTQFIYNNGSVVGINSDFWDFVLSGFSGLGNNIQHYYNCDISEIPNPIDGDICSIPETNDVYIYYKGSWNPWIYVSSQDISNWNNKLDRINNAVAGNLAIIDQYGNLTSGIGIDIVPTKNSNNVITSGGVYEAITFDQWIIDGGWAVTATASYDNETESIIIPSNSIIYDILTESLITNNIATYNNETIIL